MIYTIDGTITYNSEDGTLSHIPTQESLSLSISAGRLFERLLDSEGAILSRETLLTDVWDKYGLRGSNSNLNQYLSILRRALATYGCENLIITIPKVGIRLNTDIPVERVEPAPETLPEPDPETDSLTEAEVCLPEPQANIKGAMPSRWFFFLVVIVCLAGTTGWGYVMMHKNEVAIAPATLDLTGGCRAVILQEINDDERQSITSQIQLMLQENHQTCNAHRRVYFDRDTSFTTRKYGRTILSSCKLNSDGHVISCDNFYYIGWRME